MRNISIPVMAVLIVWALPIARADAQSLSAAPQPSTEIQSLTKALEGDWTLSVKFEPNASAPKLRCSNS